MKIEIHAIALVSALVMAGCTPAAAPRQATSSAVATNAAWQMEFGIAQRHLVATGRNPYFILEPGYQCIYESNDGKLVITVLDDTLDVAGVTTRVVEEREWAHEKLIEVSRNYFALCRDTKDVFYFGEDVDMYKDERVVGHEGTWRAGEKAAKPGLMIPGVPRVGMKYQQEVAPGVAMDRSEVISLSAKLQTPAGIFDQCLQTQEGSALKPKEKEFKAYAPGVGLVQDAEFLLLKHGFIRK